MQSLMKAFWDGGPLLKRSSQQHPHRTLPTHGARTHDRAVLVAHVLRFSEIHNARSALAMVETHPSENPTKIQLKS